MIEKYIPPSERMYLADGTFKIVPMGIFTQLFVIYIAYKGTIFPLLYILMTKKTQKAYEETLEYIESNIFELRPTKFMADFEEALRKAVMIIYPGIKLLGCWFHYCQAVCRYSQKTPEILSVIARDEEVRQACHKILKLPCFSSIRTMIESKTEVFARFLNYYSRQWLRKVGFFFIWLRFVLSRHQLIAMSLIQFAD